VLQQIKSLIRDQLGLPPVVVLVVTGCVSHLLLNVLLRKPPSSAWGLLAPGVLGLALESYEIWVQYKSVGLFAPGNDPLLVILWRHGLDILKMLVGPALLVVAGILSGR
jgi:hypothetical protein